MKLPVSLLGKKLSPYLKLAAAIIFAVLALFAAIRIVSWHHRGESARLLTLVNPWNPVSETGYQAKLTGIGEGFQVDRACADALSRMLSDCREAGCQPVLRVEKSKRLTAML